MQKLIIILESTHIIKLVVLLSWYHLDFLLILYLLILQEHL